MAVAAEEIRRVDAQLRPVDPQWADGLLKKNRGKNGRQREQKRRGIGQGGVSTSLRGAPGELNAGCRGCGKTRPEQIVDSRQGDIGLGRELVNP